VLDRKDCLAVNSTTTGPHHQNTDDQNCSEVTKCYVQYHWNLIYYHTSISKNLNFKNLATIHKCCWLWGEQQWVWFLTDGLVDCVDPDCCISASCKDSIHCRTAPEPMEILLRKQPPSSSASFYERMRFLIEDDSVQSYATLSSFNQRFCLWLCHYYVTVVATWCSG